MNARDFMTKDPACCSPDSNLRDVARLMVEHMCGAIPVCDSSRKPVGVVTDRDIVCRAVAENRNPLQLTASDVMTSSVDTVTPDTSLEECVRLMEQDKVRRLVVVDQNGRTCGMLSQADLARTGNYRETAEVVQQISQPEAVPSRPAMSR